MIARFWSAQTTAAQLDAYIEHVNKNVLPVLQAVEGYAGAQLLQRRQAEEVEIMVTTWWHSLEAIRGFAGDQLEEAVVADEAAALLTRFDHRVRHYEVVIRDDPRG